MTISSARIEAKEILAHQDMHYLNRIKFTELTKGRNRYEGVGHIKNNILMIGPTGVGKTYLIKLIAEKDWRALCQRG